MRAPALAVGICLFASAGASADPIDWLQFGFDARHSGASTQETIVNAGNVSTLHPIWHVVLPSIADGAPAFLSSVSTASGLQNVLFLNTKDGRLLALDAATGAAVWPARRPATGPNYTTSSPAIDPGRIYVYAYALDGKVHKYQVRDGTEITTGGWPEVATLKPSVEKGSSALSLATTTGGTRFLYVANGGYPGDAGDYQGHVTTIDLATGTQRVWNTMCSDQSVHFVSGGTPDCAGGVQSAVWARIAAVYDPDNDKLFFATGNGTYDAATGGHKWGDSVIAIHPDGTGSGPLPVDSYTPTEFQALQDQDADIGSTGPALLPVPPGSKVPHLAVQCGKDAKVRLLDLDDLSGQGGPAHTGGELQKLDVPQGGEVLTAPAVWTDPRDGRIWVFLANGNGISGLELAVDGTGNPSLTSRWTNSTGGSSPIVANGIVFYAGSGNVFGLDPTTGGQLWHDTSIGGIHWESPIVVDGHLYLTDESNQLWAYAPNPAPLNFFTLPPCRLIDTRGPAGTYGAPALPGGFRSFPLTGRCGIPAGAQAVAANLTVVPQNAAGAIRVAPSGVASMASTVNFHPGPPRANNAILSLTGFPLGSVTVETDVPPGGAAHLIVDVTGYFE
ncbi:MAG: PQQ-binding-like beta-propeller repeat protein [Acidobacteriota bacterium]|nr:PQQ-binding-like beta-propeller repeat protein [Acidobacteriota bacterium]